MANAISGRGDARKDARPENWLSGGGEMGKLVRSMDWTKTPLGPIESWPQSLRTTVSLCLASNFPISLAWLSGGIRFTLSASRRSVALPSSEARCARRSRKVVLFGGHCPIPSGLPFCRLFGMSRGSDEPHAASIGDIDSISRTAGATYRRWSV